jgi:hypothetical protein
MAQSSWRGADACGWRLGLRTSGAAEALVPIVQDFKFKHVADLLREFKFIFKCRKECIAGNLPVDQGQVQVRASRQRLLINLRAAADINIIRKFLRIQFFQRIKYEDFGLSLFTQFGKVKLVWPFYVFASAPFVVLAKDFRVMTNQALRMTGENEISAARQRVPQALKCFASHDDDVPHRLLPEPPEILRQMPGDLSIRADHAVERHRRYGFEMFQGWMAEIIMGSRAPRNFGPRCNTYKSTPHRRKQSEVFIARKILARFKR